MNKFSQRTVIGAMRTVIRTRSLAAFLVFVLFTGYYAYQPQEQQKGPQISGYVVVHDGDSMRVNGTKIRLFGIDSPELEQICQLGGSDWNCGKEARQYLIRLIGTSLVICIQKDTSYDRLVATCKIGNTDLAREMVLNGYAVAYRKYSQDYVMAEEEAKLLKKGIWKGSFKEPWLWRKEHKL